MILKGKMIGIRPDKNRILILVFFQVEIRSNCGKSKPAKVLNQSASSAPQVQERARAL